jgi:hypothetical protein
MTIDDLRAASTDVVANAAVHLRARNLANGLCEHGTHDGVCNACEDGTTLRESLQKETSEAVSKMAEAAMWMSLCALSNMDDSAWRELLHESKVFLYYVGRLNEAHIREAAGTRTPV